MKKKVLSILFLIPLTLFMFSCDNRLAEKTEGAKIRYCLMFKGECAKKGFVHEGTLLYEDKNLIKIRDKDGKIRIYSNNAVGYEIVVEEEKNKARRRKL